MSKAKPPHPKMLRPDICWPSPDPSKEPISYEYKVGDKIIIKPDVYFESYDLGGLVGTIKDVDSYLLSELVVINPASGEIEVKVFKLLRYEVELFKGDDNYQNTLPPWVGRKK